MELFDEVVIEGVGENSRLVAKDTVQNKSFVLEEGKVITGTPPSGRYDSVVIVESGATQIKSRKIFTSAGDADAFAKEIANKAFEVSKAKRDAISLINPPSNL